MKNILSVLLIFFTLNLDAQVNLELYGGFQYSKVYNTFLDIDGAFSPNFGIGVSGKLIGENTRWLTGFQYFSYSEKSESELRWGTQHNGSGGFDGETSILKAKTTYLYLELPFAVRQFLHQGKLSFFVQPAILPSVYLTTHRARTWSHPNGDQTSENKFGRGNNRSLNIQAALSLGMQIPLSSKTRILIMPYASTQLTRLVSQGNSNARFYGLGLRGGLQFGL